MVENMITTYTMCVSSATSRRNLIATRSSGKPSDQSSFFRYLLTSPIPLLPWRMLGRRPSASWQSSENRASNRLLNVSNGASPSCVCHTIQILSFGVAFGTEGGSELERVEMFFASCTISSIVGIVEDEESDRHPEYL